MEANEVEKDGVMWCIYHMEPQEHEHGEEPLCISFVMLYSACVFEDVRW
jgi:hypothetical protein